MKNKHQNLINDIIYIFSECEIFTSKIKNNEFKNIQNEDLFYEIPHPNHKNSKLICGKKAGEKLSNIAKNIAKNHKLEKRIKHSKLIEISSRVIVNRLLRDNHKLNDREIDRIISSTVKQAKKHCINITHFIPCHLMKTPDPLHLSLGSIKFHNRSSIRRLFLEKLSQRTKEKTAEQEKEARAFLCNAIRYYRKFQWVAEVEIKECDPESSTEIAEQAVTSALDCLHLMFGARWSDRMQIHGPAIKIDRRAKLYFSDGHLNASLSSSSIGQVNFESGWSDQLASSEFLHLIDLFGVALEAAVDPNLDRPLSRRFLDAAQWFGEASRDKSPSTRVVKYITALERMVMTEEKNDISRLVSDRVSAFCFDKLEDRELWREKVKKTYDLRSKLVHGNISPRSDEVWQGVDVGAQLCEITLLGVLNEFGAEGLKKDKFTSKRLGKWFDTVTTWTDDQLNKK